MATERKNEDNPLLTYIDAGKIAGVSHSTISKWVDGGDGPLGSVPMPGSTRRRVRKQTLLDFLDALESSATSASSASLEDS